MVAGDEPLNWAVVKITISVDGGISMQCDRDGYDDGYSDCVPQSPPETIAGMFQKKSQY